MTALATIEKRPIASPQDVVDVFARAAVRAHFPETDQFGNPSISRFLSEHGRLPAITDDVKPWCYRGWLVPYVQMCEQHPDIAPRYHYVIRTLEEGKLLDEPIPQIGFVAETAKEAGPGFKMLNDMVKITQYRSGWSRGIDQVAGWLGFALGVTEKPPEISDDEQEELYRLFDVSKWLLAPADYIGAHMAEQGHGKAGGFFPTPMHVCTMLTAMTFGEFGDEDTRCKTVNDPCVGTGRFLLAGSNYSLRLFGQDINYLCVLVTKINLALYAPWFYIPDSYFPKQQKSEEQPLVTNVVASPEPVYTTAVDQPSLFEL
jgi:hypothetical protein